MRFDELELEMLELTAKAYDVSKSEHQKRSARSKSTCTDTANKSRAVATSWQHRKQLKPSLKSSK